ncbi:MAG: BACON domain-containing protein [Alistipes sp.]|nr:BACON domain-containing protein [Alistipes sp.]
MKLRNLFFALLALPLAFVACEPEPTPEPEPQPEQIVLILTSNEVMNFSAAGGAGEITYAMDLKGQDLQLTATSEAEWISDITVDTNITFTVAANDGAAREDKIVATCGTKSFEVTVKQAAKVAVPALVITSENPLEVNHEEQMGTITYTVENPKEGVSVTASCSANWISQLAVQEANNKVVFLVAANSGAAREAVVTLTYGLLEQKVTIKQSEFVAEAPVINVESKLDVAAEGGAQSLAYTVDNKVEGVELTATCEAEWISNIVVAAEAITFDVAANEDIMREATLVLTYGAVTAEVTITQLPVGANEDMVYSTFGIVEFAAKPSATDWWDITMHEHDPNKGIMYTRLSIKLAEGNAMFIPDGTYSVANGGILINTQTVNDYSTYRYNVSGDTADIIDATIEVSNNFERKSSTIKGTFTVGNNIISFQYIGAVNGFMYEQISEDGITEWTTFTTRYGWDDIYILNATADGVTIQLNIHELGASKSNHGTCPSVGEYIVDEWHSPTEHNYIEKESTFGFINGANLDTGKLVVEDAGNGNTTISFDIIDEFGTQWKGSYTGAL